MEAPKRIENACFKFPARVDQVHIRGKWAVLSAALKRQPVSDPQYLIRLSCSGTSKLTPLRPRKLWLN